jgi:hypothetical protein
MIGLKIGRGSRLPSWKNPIEPPGKADFDLTIRQDICKHSLGEVCPPLRLADEIYNVKVGRASSPEKPKQVPPTKKLLPSSQFPLSFVTGSTQVTILHFRYGEFRNVIINPARFSSSK